MRWPETGQWYVEIDGDPLGVAAGILTQHGALGPLDPGSPVVLVPDGRAADALWRWRSRLSGRSAVVTADVVTPMSLARWFLPGVDAHPSAGSVELSEIARAVDHALRRDPGFPLLTAFPEGASLPKALERLVRDMRLAGLGSRDAGAVTTLEALDPPELAPELLQAMGMFEGTLERLGWWDDAARWEAAAAAAERTTPRPWIVCADRYVPMPVIQVLRALGWGSPVLWLVARREERPAHDATWPERRSLAWAGAARWADPDLPAVSLNGTGTGSATGAGGRGLDIQRVAGPADLACRAVSLAAGDPGTLLVAASPGSWVGLLEEACARVGLNLVGDRGPGSMGAPLRWIRGLVDGWAGEITASRAVDLIDLGQRLGLPGWPAEPWSGAAADRRLRQRGVVRGKRAVLGTLRDHEGGGLAEAFALLDAASDGPTALRSVMSLLMDARLHRRAASVGPLLGREEAEQVGSLLALLEDLAARLPLIWHGAAAHTPGLLLARVEDGVRQSLPRRQGGLELQRGPVVRLAALETPLPPTVTRVVLLGISESDVRVRGSATHLIPDRVRASSAVSSQAHWPWHADQALSLGGALERLCDPESPVAVTALVPACGLGGRQHIPWSGLPESPREAPMFSLAREPSMGPGEVRLGPGPYGGAATARALGVFTGLSASTVDGYRSCPRRCYMERVLRVGDREAVGYDLDPRERGDWLHRLLRKLFVSRPRWWDGAPDAADVRRMLGELEDPGVWGRGVAASGDFLELQAQRSLDALATRLADHGAVLAQTPAGVTVGIELEVQLPGDLETGCPPLRGTLDRLDLLLGPDGMARGFLVFDYKTGRIGAYSASRDTARRKQQLFLYAVLMEGVLGLPCLGALAITLLGDEKPCGAIVTDHHEADLAAWVEATKRGDRVTRAELEVAMEEARTAARDVAAGISLARFPAKPMQPSLCDGCAQSQYCPRVLR